MLKIRIETKTRLPAVLLATRSQAVLNRIPVDIFQTREAVSTLGVTSALHADPLLVIADVDDLIEFPELSRAALATALHSLGEDGRVVVTSAQFAAEPDRWIGEALLARGSRSGVRYMPPRVVMITNYCGGVGKTTLSLALVKRFRKASGLATALVEAGVGGSSLKARLPGQRASLYEVVTQNAEAGQWEDVTVFPADNWEADVLAADERTPKTLHDIAHSHTLTAFDTFPTNPLWKHIVEMATDILVVAAPRQDSLVQTDAVLRRLKDETAAIDPAPRVHLVLNQVRTVGERLPLVGQLSAWIGYDERRANHLDGALAEPLLNLVYPGWGKRKLRLKAKQNRNDKETAEAAECTALE